MRTKNSEINFKGLKNTGRSLTCYFRKDILHESNREETGPGKCGSEKEDVGKGNQE